MVIVIGHISLCKGEKEEERIGWCIGVKPIEKLVGKGEG